MKSLSRINLRSLALGILITAISLLVYLIRDFNKTESSLARALITKTQQTTLSKLDNYFSEIEDIVDMASFHASSSQIKYESEHGLKTYFYPILQKGKHIKYAAIANSEGHEEVLYKQNDQWITIHRDINKYGENRFLKTWEYSKDRNWKYIETNQDVDTIDHRERDWFKGPIKNKPNVYWTNPFFYSTGEAGVSATKHFESTTNIGDHVVGFGLTLKDISEFTQELQASPNSKVFILSPNGSFVGLPNDSNSKNSSTYADTKNKTVSISAFPIIEKAYVRWSENNSNIPYLFKYDGKNWYGSFLSYYLSDKTYLNIGIVLPQSDILSEMQRTKRIIVGSFIFILILTGFVIYSNSLTQKANILLANKNRKISEQHCVIEQKNKHILDSINYAKRIQHALLPPLTQINKALKDNFLLYKPKDVVAGDFYWLEVHEGTTFFAAADCTGHGVPGAMVSFVCIKALNQAVIDFSNNTPASILDKTRDLVIQEFKKSDDEVKDGMDIALCSIKGNTLQYAGANNAMYLIRNNELIETKADKQPIGNYSKQTPYTNHTFKLQERDTIYLFSDGYADQFGGPDNRKYKTKNLKTFLLSIQNESMKKQHELLNDNFESWRGKQEQIDDVCFWGYLHNPKL